MIVLLADHLWQSTLFILAAALATLLLRNHSPGVRYGLWFAASVKFLVPFVLLGAAGGALVSRLHLTLASPPLAATMASVASPLTWASSRAMDLPQLPAPAAPALAFTLDWASVLLAVWAVGLAVILLAWAVRWGRIRTALGAATPIDLRAAIPVLCSPARLEPGVVGLWRPALLLPEGISERLSMAEFNAILDHELCHVRRRDNLTAAMHMLVQALFWFHPLVWWLGRQLIVERERACDEAVVRAGHDRETYAGAIIGVCRLYLPLPLSCVAGASGSDLEKRVEEILDRPLSARLPLAAKASIGMIGALVVGSPVLAGAFTALPPAVFTTPIPEAGPMLIAVAETQPPRTLIGPDSSQDLLAQRLAEQQRPRAVVPFDPASFDRYAGYYRLDPRRVIKVSRDGAKLFVQIVGQTPIEIYAESRTKFFATVFAAQFSFTVDSKSVATSLVLHQGGLEQRAEKITANEAKLLEEAAPKPRRLAAFDPTHFDRYVGSYQLGPSTILKISRDGAKLFTQRTGEVPVEVYPESETRFFASPGAAEISFTVDAKGAATGLTLHQNGRDMPAPRIAVTKAQAIETALAKRIVEDKPSPGTEEFIRRYVQSVEAGSPDYSGMAPALAEFSRSRRDATAVLTKVWGPLRAVQFEGVTPQGLDRYLVVFANARIPVLVEPPDAAGKIAIFDFAPA